MRARLEPAFLDGFAGGRRFALWVLPAAGVAPRGALLCVQPFGDEANLARRVLVAQATRLAARGWTTLVLDLFGTGDSDGRTDEARLAVWRADLLHASRLARQRAEGPFVLWGTRLGAVLAAELGIALDQLADGYVFWQPAANGAAFIDPLTKLARVGAIARDAAAGRGGQGAPGAPAASTSSASAASASTSSASTASPSQPAPSRLSPSNESPSGQPAPATTDLAGYRLRTDLLDELRAATMQPPALGAAGAPCPVLMLGIQRVAPAGGVAPKALSELAARWLDEGYLTRLRVVQGEPFWSSLEPSTPEAAFEATEDFLETLDARAQA